MKTIAYLRRITLISMFILISSCSKNGEFELLDGRKQSIDDYSGQWLVVNFWAEWCSPCIKEIPELNRLASSSAEHNVAVIGVSYDLVPNQKLIKDIKKLNFQYPVMATDPVPILPFKLPASLPTNYIIAPDGTIAAKLVGTQDFDSLIKELKKAKALFNSGKA